MDWKRTTSSFDGSESVEEDEEEILESSETTGGSTQASFSFQQEEARNEPADGKPAASPTYNFFRGNVNETNPSTEPIEKKVNFGENRITKQLKREDLAFRTRYPTHPALKYPPYLSNEVPAFQKVSEGQTEKEFSEIYENSIAAKTKKARVQGERKIFFCESLCGIWKMQLLRGKRMKLPSTGFVAVQNNSRYFSEKQGRGSLAMLFDARKDRDFIAIDSNRDEQKTPSNSLKWRLIVCHSVLEEGTKFYYFKSNIEVDFRNQQFIPRNVFSDYLLEFVNLGGPNFELDNFRYPVLVNEVDGCMDAHVKPSYLCFFIPREAAEPVVKNKKRGKRGKNKPSFAKQLAELKDLGENWLTILVSAKEKVPYEHCLHRHGKQSGILIFPSPESSRILVHCSGKGNFYMVKYHEIEAKEVEKMNGLSENKILPYLESVSRNSFQLLEVETKLPIRFVACNFDVHDLDLVHFECEKVTIGEYKFSISVSNTCNVLLPGTVTSMWKLHKVNQRFNLKDLQDVQDAYGKGYGSREVSWCAGVNFYQGPKFSHRQLLNPLEGPGEGRMYNPYYRKYYSNPEKAAPVSSKISSAVRSTANEIFKVNGNYFRFVRGAQTCSREIWTQGITGRSRNTLTVDGQIRENY